MPAYAAALRLIAALAVAAVLAMPAQARAQSLADLVTGAQAAKVAPKGTPKGTQAIFGSREFKTVSLQGLPQWQRVLGKMKLQSDAFRRCSEDPAACRTTAQKAWRHVILEAAKLAPKDRLRFVNSFFNKKPYREDAEIYGVKEYWATPAEFLQLSGDCEDYAIAKFFALRQLGYGSESMRIVVLWDEIRGIGHAILAVYQDRQILVLDNLSGLIVPHERYKHYIPQYSMNETSRWAHIHAKKIPTLVAQN